MSAPQRVDATGQGIARYAVYYGNLTSGGATIAGLVGRASFDSSLQRPADWPPHNPPMQWTEPAGKLLVVREPARRRLGH